MTLTAKDITLKRNGLIAVKGKLLQNLHNKAVSFEKRTFSETSLYLYQTKFEGHLISEPKIVQFKERLAEFLNGFNPKHTISHQHLGGRDAGLDEKIFVERKRRAARKAR